MKKRIKKNSRHIRWNWEISQDSNADKNDYVRYHFVVIDDRDRDGILERLLSSLGKYGELVPIRRVSGKVRSTDFLYLFCSYDCVIKPEMIDWASLGKPVKKDANLRERKIGNIEDYIAKVYG